MPIAKEKKQRIEAEVRELLKRHGNARGAYGWPDYAQQNQISERTLMRIRVRLWTGQIAAQYAKREKARKRAAERARQQDVVERKKAGVAKKEIAAIAKRLPEVPVGPGALGLDVSALARRLEDCAVRADKLLAYCEREDGSIRNPKLYGTGIEIKRRVAETVPRVMQFLWSVHQAERTIRLMFDVIADEEPATANRILNRIHEANRAMGIYL